MAGPLPARQPTPQQTSSIVDSGGGAAAAQAREASQCPDQCREPESHAFPDDGQATTRSTGVTPVELWGVNIAAPVREGRSSWLRTAERSAEQRWRYVSPTTSEVRTVRTVPTLSEAPMPCASASTISS